MAGWKLELFNNASSTYFCIHFITIVYRDGPTKGKGGPPPQQTISLKILSILDDSYFRVYSWPPSNFWIGSNSPKETNHLTFSLRQWPPIVQIYTTKNP